MSSLASNPTEPTVYDGEAPISRPDCPWDIDGTMGTAEDLTLVQTVEKSGSNLGKQHNVDPRDQVLRNQDILPLIFLYLKERGQLDCHGDSSHHGPDGQELGQSYSWKASLASLIVVNRPFFHTGANLLWHTMDSFTPVLKLFPWFSVDYKGIGSYKYTGSKDWGRFRAYSSRVRHFKINRTPDVVIPHDRLLQLLLLHERPDPFFENLHSITFFSEASQALHMLFLGIGPPLQNLKVIVATLEQKDEVLAVLPVLSSKTKSLATFHYSGPICREFIFQLSNIKLLHRLTLKMGAASHLQTSDLALLRNLSNLQTLTLEFEPGFFKFTDRKALMANLVWKRTSSEPETCGWQLELNGRGAALLYASWSIAPTQLRCLTLQVTGYTDNHDVLTFLELFFENNRSLETFSMDFGPIGSLGGYVSPRVKAPRVKAHGTSRATQALGNHEQITAFVMSDLPHQTGTCIFPVLQASVPRWKRLKNLHFRLHESAFVPENGTRCFPGLLFLFTICKECPDIEMLNFQFDEEQIIETSAENLNLEGLPFPTIHPLRSLSIGTVDNDLALDMAQKVVIAAYITGLFPRLETLTGFADKTWSDIEVLVKMYQTVRKWGPLHPHMPSE